MYRKRRLATGFVLTAAAFLHFSQLESRAQSQPQVSVVNLKVVRNSDGSTSVITPKGDLATLPGAGVNGDFASIYIGSNGGFWYQDRAGQTIDLYPTYKALQERRQAAEKAAEVPQYAPNPYYQQAPTQESSGSSGSGLATAAAAGMGAMAGAAMSNHYYNAPYGTPMYFGPGGQPYYYQNGERRTLEEVGDDLNQNQKMAIYNKRKAENQQKQELIAQGQSNRQARQDSVSQSRSGRQASRSERQQGAAQFESMQQQQQWYQKQLREGGERTQQWKGERDNPFVAEQFAGNREGREARGGRGGRDAGASRGGRERPSRSGGGGRRGRGR